MLTCRQSMLAAASAAAPLSTAWAEYSGKPIRFVVPVSAGTGTDLIADAPIGGAYASLVLDTGAH